MKSSEILLASAVIAVVAGAGTALATRAFQTSPRTESARSAPSASPSAGGTSTGADATGRALDELRMENTSLKERVAALEAQVGELAGTRTQLAREVGAETALALAHDESAGSGAQNLATDDEFVASVGQAMDQIEKKEDAERAKHRKELQAARIEERLTKLQQELGLTNRQTTDMRTALLAADDKREALFNSLREGEGDPRDLRDSFRELRDTTYASLKSILTPEQFETYKEKDDEFGKRDFGGPQGGGGPEAFGRPQRAERGERGGQAQQRRAR